MRKEAREAAFKIVFAESLGGDEECSEKDVYKKANLKEDEKKFADTLVTLTREHRQELLEVLDNKVTRFTKDRIYPVDRAILLIALAEILYVDDVPPIVSVNEATGLARTYSTENSAGFVNGVLAGVINE